MTSDTFEMPKLRSKLDAFLSFVDFIYRTRKSGTRIFYVNVHELELKKVNTAQPSVKSWQNKVVYSLPVYQKIAYRGWGYNNELLLSAFADELDIQPTKIFARRRESTFDQMMTRSLAPLEALVYEAQVDGFRLPEAEFGVSEQKRLSAARLCDWKKANKKNWNSPEWRKQWIR